MASNSRERFASALSESAALIVGASIGLETIPNADETLDSTQLSRKESTLRRCACKGIPPPCYTCLYHLQHSPPPYQDCSQLTAASSSTISVGEIGPEKTVYREPSAVKSFSIANTSTILEVDQFIDDDDIEEMSSIVLPLPDLSRGARPKTTTNGISQNISSNVCRTSENGNPSENIGSCNENPINELSLARERLGSVSAFRRDASVSDNSESYASSINAENDICIPPSFEVMEKLKKVSIEDGDNGSVTVQLEEPSHNFNYDLEPDASSSTSLAEVHLPQSISNVHTFQGDALDELLYGEEYFEESKVNILKPSPLPSQFVIPK